MSQKTNTTNNLTTVLFDLDGTLLDTALDFKVAMERIIKELNYKQNDVCIDKIRKHISFGGREVVKRTLNLDEKNPEFDNIINKFLQYYNDTNHVNTKPFTGVLEVLYFLNTNNINWGIVTNKLTRFTEKIINSKEYLHPAKVVVCGDTTNSSKPNPEPMLYAANKLNVSPNECVYLGDANTDIIAGNSAGMFTVTALFGYIPSLGEASTWDAKHKVNNAIEFRDWLQSNLLY